MTDGLHTFTPTAHVRPLDWMADALCAEIGTDLFFAEQANDPENRKAKAVCADCPVTAECLALAIANHEVYGVWGGLGPAERMRLRGVA